MIIGVDGNEANVEKKVGVSVYTMQLLKYFSQIANENLQFCIFLKYEKNKNLPQETKFFYYKVIKGKFLWSQIFLPFYLFFNKNIDLFFAPAHYAPRFLNIPLILTIHDLSYFYFPHEFLKSDLYKLKNWTAYSINKAKAIIAVSKRTKKDISRFYSNKEEITKVIYNGFEKNIPDINSTTPNLEKFGISKKNYILYVGTLQPRKNIVRLIRAFKLITQKNINLKLVIAGKKGWLFDSIYKEIKILNIENKVVFTDYVSDADLVALYKNAVCFVMPSLYEGFGIPILEAMSYDLPVVSSNSSSLPEIGADSCLYFDPLDENDMAQKIQTVLSDTNLQKNLRLLGKERVKFFSWKKCAAETVAVITALFKNEIR